MRASTIKLRLLSLGLLLLVYACSSNPAHRPEPDEPEVQNFTLSFAPYTIFHLSIGGISTSISITTLRENGTEAPRQSTAIAVTALKGEVKAPDELIFEAGETQKSFTIDYRCPALALGQSDIIGISIGELSAKITIEHTLASSRKALYVKNFESSEVNLTTDGDTYIIESPELRRTIAMRGGLPYVHSGSGVIDISDAYTQLAQTTAWVPYAFSAKSSYDTTEQRLNLVVLADGADVPTTEYLFLSSSNEWETLASATFIDPWVLPRVSLNAELLDPAAHPWPVWLQQSKTEPSSYRIIDPYRGNCPLSLYNDAPAGATLSFAISDDKVTFAQNTSLFTNPDIKAPLIGGTGVLHRGAEADTIITDNKPILIISR